MKYRNAQEVLPKDLIEEIQKYMEGEYLYIPTKNKRKSWGEKSGLKRELRKRNKEIFNKYKDGLSVEELINEYYLTESSIKRIIREEKDAV